LRLICEGPISSLMSVCIIVSLIAEHDDRVSDCIRRVSFKPGSNRIGKQRNRDLDQVVRSHIEDGDVDMTTPGSNGRSLR
jgi:hypothetical protein